MRPRDVNFFLQHQDSRNFYKKEWIGLSDIIKNIEEKERQTHTHTRTHTQHTSGCICSRKLSSTFWIEFFSLRSLHGKPQLQTLPSLDTTWTASALLETGWIFLNVGHNVEEGDMFWATPPSPAFWSALIKALFKACPVPLGLEARMFIDTLVREGCLVNAGDCGKVSELGKRGKDMRY